MSIFTGPKPGKVNVTPKQKREMQEPCPSCKAFKKNVDPKTGKWFCAWCGFEEGQLYLGGSVMQAHL